MLDRVIAVIALSFSSSFVLAEDTDPNLPNPLRTENLVATCNQLSAQIRAAEPATMARLVGVWEGQTILAGVAGLYRDTPQQVRVTNNPDGTFANDYYACFQPYGQQPACASSFQYGEWMAHETGDGWIAVAYLSYGSGYGGEVLPVSCGLNYVQLVDPNTMVDQAGAPLYRRQ
jgi:hypothetical protein